MNYENIISLHFRVGDYPSMPNHHPVMTLQYYKKALDHILKKTNKKQWTVLYFNQTEDNDIICNKIIELKKIYPDIDFIQVSHELQDWEQMLQMSLCHHNIIAK